MTQINTITAGIDTSKAKLDIAIDGQTTRWQVANDLPGWRRLAADLMKAGVARVGIETSDRVASLSTSSALTFPQLEEIKICSCAMASPVNPSVKTLALTVAAKVPRTLNIFFPAIPYRRQRHGAHRIAFSQAIQSG